MFQDKSLDKQLCIFHCFNNITINDNARYRISNIFIWSKTNNHFLWFLGVNFHTLFVSRCDGKPTLYTSNYFVRDSRCRLHVWRWQHSPREYWGQRPASCCRWHTITVILWLTRSVTRTIWVSLAFYINMNVLIIDLILPDARYLDKTAPLLGISLDSDQ